MKTVKRTAEEVRAALRLRYPIDSHALLFEVADSTGYGRHRFADAIAVSLWKSHGHKIEGIEVKVSRSDFLNEMKQPQKSQPIFQYCHRWWLACPKDMVRPDELPPTWGLLELHDTGLRQKVAAPKLDPVPLTVEFLASMLRRHAGHDEDMSRAAITTGIAAEREHMRATLRHEFEDKFNRDIEAAKQATAAWEAVKEQTGIDLMEYRCTDELVHAIRVVRGLTGGWRSPLAELRKAANDIVQTIDDSGLGTEVPEQKKEARGG